MAAQETALKPEKQSVEIKLAHSPDSDDAFMFYALATHKLPTPGYKYTHVLSDIQTLNEAALAETYDVTAVSFAAYPSIRDKYMLLDCGASFGEGYGPIVVSARPFKKDDLKGKRIAVPGTLTTAYLACRLFQPDFQPVVTPFDKITDAVRERTVDLGLIIHEAQLTYDREGFHRIIDLGRWFKSTFELPLPLGGNVLLRSLDREIQSECCRLMRESIQYALDNHAEALTYALQFARDMEPRLAEKFVGMYVNHYTLDAGEVIPRAAQKLLDLGHEAGLISKRVEVEFVK